MFEYLCIISLYYIMIQLDTTLAVLFINNCKNTLYVSDVHRFLHDHPYYRVCPDILSLVGDPLSGHGCGSPNHTVLVISFGLFTSFILDTKKRGAV